MYFYVINGPRRVGFGITKNPEGREKDYTGAWGYEAQFSALWYGNRRMVTTLEDTIKIMHRERLWHIDFWYTEWFEDLTLEQAIAFVEDIIQRTHLDLARTR